MKHRAYVAAGAFLVTGLLQDGLGAHRAAAREVLQFGDAGYLNIDYQVQARAGVRDQGPNPALEENTYDYYLRRNRLSFIGGASEMFSAVVQLEFNGGQRLGDTSVMAESRKFELTLLDAFATADFFDFLKVRVGKTKHVLTREVQEGCFDPLTIDRSPFILGPFGQRSGAETKTTRDTGLVVWGNVYDNHFQYRLAAMQGGRFGSDLPDGIGYRYTGRVHLTLFDKEAGPVYRGTYLGKKRVLTLGAGYELQPNAVHSSGTTGAEDYKAFTLDAFYEHPTSIGTFTVSSAYLKADFGEAGIRGVADAQGAFGERNGYLWKAAYMPGEGVLGRYLGNAQVYGRYERWSFASLGGVIGEQLQWVVAGVNYYFKGQDARLTVEYSATGFDKAQAKDFQTVLVQLQLRDGLIW